MSNLTKSVKHRRGKAAESVRTTSMERLSERKIREQEENGEEEITPKRNRSSGGDTIAYLREKSEKDFQRCEQELKVVNITYVMIKLQFKLPQALISISCPCFSAKRD